MFVSDVPQAVNPNPQPVVHVARCHTHRCWRRVGRRRHIQWRWRYYKAHSMPRCTWDGESASRGARISEYAPIRYHARNPSSTAGGKYQIIDTTWYGYGGNHYNDAYPAAVAPPLEQEKIARRVLAGGGLSQWANC